MPDAPHLPCPECRLAGVGGNARIGSNRNKCKLCNRFGQTVMRLANNRLRAQFQPEYRAFYAQVERDTYPAIVDEWLKAHPDV